MDWIGWTVFAFVMAITPGPNNALVMGSGLRFGVARSLPHVSGVALGFGAMFVVVEFGVAALLAARPALLLAMQAASVAVIGWMAWRIATAPFAPIVAPSADGGAHAGGDAGRPWGFWTAAAFQWINPKAWLVCASAIGGFVGASPDTARLLGMAAVMAAVTWLSAGAWAAGGALLARGLDTPARQRTANVALALALLASLAAGLG